MAAVTEKDITGALAAGTLLRGVRTLKKKHLAIETGFTYPDGGSIEVYVVNESMLADANHLTITDFGNTVNWLMNLGIKAWQGPSKRELVKHAVSPYDVEVKGAELRITGLPLANLHDGIIRLAQACLRVADISYTKRFRPATDFQAQVEDMLGEFELPYEAGYEIPLVGDKRVKVDAYVRGATKESALLLLSTASEVYAHQRAIEVFARWADLIHAKRPEQRIAIWDTSTNAFSQDDLDRVARSSEVIPVGERDYLKQKLAA